VKYHTFRKKKYRIVDTESCLGGECDDPNTKNKWLIVPVEGEEFYDLYVIIHEAVHACLWDLDETAVEEIAMSIARFIWRLGWRKQY
jgi:hypothetical protein